MTASDPDRDGPDAARNDLERLRQEGDLLGGALAALPVRLVRHFAATDTGDPVELWGRRIGRALAAIAFLGFCVYLYFVHVLTHVR